MASNAADEMNFGGDGAIRQQNIMRGVLLIIAAALTISIQDAVFKKFSGELTLWQIFALHGILAVAMLLTLSGLRGMHQGVTRSAKWLLLRSDLHRLSA